MSTNKHQHYEKFYRIFQDLVDFAVFTMNKEGRITSWNAGAKNIFGYDESEIVGQPLARIFTDADRLTQQVKWEMATAEKDGRADDERWHVRKNGELFWASGVLSVVRDENGKIDGFVKVIRDLTERKRAEDQRNRLLQELRQASEAKDRFLATLSHELRTPLAAITGWVSLIREKRLRSDQIEAAVESTYRNALIQKGLIDDLLDISRITAGQLTLDMGPMDVSEIVQRGLESVRFMAVQKHIEIDSDIEQTIPSILADSRRVQQIIWNLLANAIKFTPKDGRVEIRVHHRDGNIEFQIRDTGQGISREFLPHVFDIFRQEQDSTSRPFGGMGLGLAIVKQLTELHGGSVKAFSEGVGKGSTFTVIFPAVEVSAPHQSAQAAAVDIAALANKRVLILENDLDCREFLATAVEGHGAVAYAAATARDALDKVLEFRPDVVLVDLVLPEEDGYQFVKRLRAFRSPSIRSIPAIAVTALATDEFRKRAMAEGFQLFIAKPVAADELVTHIANLLRRSDYEDLQRIA